MGLEVDVRRHFKDVQVAVSGIIIVSDPAIRQTWTYLQLFFFFEGKKIS
jgi:hypothetical protein